MRWERKMIDYFPAPVVTRGMKTFEEMVGENRKHRKALVWHGSGLMMLAGREPGGHRTTNTVAPREDLPSAPSSWQAAPVRTLQHGSTVRISTGVPER